MVIFLNFSLTSNHLHPLQVENCDSNSRLVVDEDDNGKFRLERVKVLITFISLTHLDRSGEVVIFFPFVQDSALLQLDFVDC